MIAGTRGGMSYPFLYYAAGGSGRGGADATPPPLPVQPTTASAGDLGPPIGSGQTGPPGANIFCFQ